MERFAGSKFLQKKKLFIPISKSKYLILLHDTLTGFSFAALKFNIGNCYYFGTGQEDSRVIDSSGTIAGGWEMKFLLGR